MPILGTFFRKETDQDESSELVIMVAPRILVGTKGNYKKRIDRKLLIDMFFLQIISF